MTETATPRSSRRVPPSWLAYGHDLMMAGLSVVLALWLRYGNSFVIEAKTTLWYGPPLFIVIAAVCFRTFGMYRGVWRYASLADLIAITKAVSVAILVWLPLLFLVNRNEGLPRTEPLIQWFVLMALLGGPRFAYRVLKDRRVLNLGDPRGTRVPVMVLGAGDQAELFIRAMTHDAAAPYQVVAVLDDRERRVGRMIHGVPVMGGASDLAAVVKRLHERAIRPQRLILARPQLAEGVELQSLLDSATAGGMTLARLPLMSELRDHDGAGRFDIRPIAVEDLLGRPQVTLDQAAIGGLIRGKVVLVTGAGGTIGSELCRQIAGFGPARLVVLDNGEYNLYRIDLELHESFPAVPRRAILADVRDGERLRRIMLAERPHAVFHAAALKHVPIVESDPAEGILTNAIGTRNTAEAARFAGARAMVLISTDKAVEPTSLMGAAKRLAECYAQALDRAMGDDPGATRFLTVRFGNVLGSTGSVVPLFERQLARGGPLTVTDPEVRRYFMTTREAVSLVLQASAHGLAHRGEPGRIFVLDMGEPVRIVDLARQMIRLAGLIPDVDVKIEFTGLRRGEKLYEDLLDAREKLDASGASGILVAHPRATDLALIRRAFDELDAIARAGDPARLVQMIRHLVPEYQNRDLPPPEPRPESARS